MLEILQLPFMQRALLAVVMLALIAAAFGSFIVLRRMAFFSDAIAHSSLAGIAIGVVLGVSPTLSAMVMAVLVALAVAAVTTRGRQALDTAIGIFYALALAIGVIVLSLSRGYRADLATFLFGDVLTVDWPLLGLMAAVLVLILVVLVIKGREFILMSLESETAKVEGIRVQANEYLFMALLALVVAVGIKLAGIIMIGPLLIIPAATAKNTARSLRETFLATGIYALLAGILGLLLSYVLNIPSGPTIVATSGVFFFLSQIRLAKA